LAGHQLLPSHAPYGHRNRHETPGIGRRSPGERGTRVSTTGRIRTCRASWEPGGSAGRAGRKACRVGHHWWHRRLQGGGAGPPAGGRRGWAASGRRGPSSAS
jgi:hypothetical protein